MIPRDTLLHRQIDEYQIEKLLGKGGMARVYRGVDVRLHRRVAIKVIDKLHRSKSEYIKRFKQEAQAIGRLEHPHIVRLYRYGELDELVYMAMQYVEGMDLAALLESYRADAAFMEIEEVTRLVWEICQGLDYAHSQGVIHRDIKPSNIMIDRAGRAILTDFGLAMLTEVTTQGHVLGSPHYLSPEQAVSSAHVVPQSDLYSLGVILYEMLTGTVPFDTEDPMEVAKMHLEAPVPLPSTFRPEISRDVERVLLKALDKNPAHRYQSGTELSHAFEKAVQSSHQTISHPSRITLPERVNLEPLALIPEKTPPPPVDPVASVFPSPPAHQKESPLPAQRGAVQAASQTPLFPVALGTGALLLALLLCGSLIAGSVWAATRLGGENSATSTTVPAISKQGLTPPSNTAPPDEVAPTDEPSPPAESAPVSTSFKLLIATEKDDSMVIVNIGNTAFFLPPLNLQEDRNIMLGSEWDVEILQPGECVIAVKDKGNPKLPDVECEEVGERLYLSSGERIWEKDFDVYYGSTKVDTCAADDDECEVVYGYGND